MKHLTSLLKKGFTDTKHEGCIRKNVSWKRSAKRAKWILWKRGVRSAGNETVKWSGRRIWLGAEVFPLMGGSCVDAVHSTLFFACWEPNCQSFGRDKELPLLLSASRLRCLSTERRLFSPPAVTAPTGSLRPCSGGWFTMTHPLAAGQTVSTVSEYYCTVACS